MNLMNKIYGRCFASVGLTQEYVNEKPEYMIAPEGPGIQYRLNKDTLEEYELSDEIIQDFMKDLKEIGTIEELRRRLHMEPNQGSSVPGLVLKHKKRTDVLADIRIHSGPITGFNPNVYQMPYDITMNLYVDVDGVGSVDYRDTEEEFKEFHALSHSGMKYGETEDEEPSTPEVIKSVTDEIEVKEEADYEDFYQSLCE